MSISCGRHERSHRKNTPTGPPEPHKQNPIRARPGGQRACAPEKIRPTTSARSASEGSSRSQKSTVNLFRLGLDEEWYRTHTQLDAFVRFFTVKNHLCAVLLPPNTHNKPGWTKFFPGEFPFER